MNPRDLQDIFEQMTSGNMRGFNTIQEVIRAYRLKVFLGENEVQSSNIETNERNAFNQWMQLCYQTAQDQRPLMVVIEYDYYKWDGSVLHVDSAEYQNLKYVKWLNEK